MNPPPPNHHRNNAQPPQDVPSTPPTEHTTGHPPGGTLIPFPVLEGEIVRERGVARLRARAVALARAAVTSPQAVQLRAVTAYRARRAPPGLLPLGGVLLRGAGPGAGEGWGWGPPGDLRAPCPAPRGARGSAGRPAAPGAN